MKVEKTKYELENVESKELAKYLKVLMIKEEQELKKVW